ncbi:hypothetical protein Aduo_017560 [Ancylostoma duodenale]
MPTVQVVHWDKEKFVREQRSSFQPFLSSLIGTDGVQYLERFIEERCRALNSGLPISDEFETEIANMDRLKMQAVNPEVIHQAVQSVKENASDVIGALKDRVTGIQIGVKLNKLTSKEIRKPKNWSIKKSSKGSGFEPMSFDNVQWHEPWVRDSSARNGGESASGYEADSDSSCGSSPRPEEPSNVPVANLIDFDTPIENPPPLSNIVSTSDPFIPSISSSAARSAVPAANLPLEPVCSLATLPVGRSTFCTSAMDPFFDPFKTPTLPEEKFDVGARSKNNWETFE